MCASRPRQPSSGVKRSRPIWMSASPWGDGMLGPFVMTALTTGLALLPFVLFGDIPGHEVARPMAAVILGGLATSTVINLFALPALYLRFATQPGPESARFQLGP